MKKMKYDQSMLTKGPMCVFRTLAAFIFCLAIPSACIAQKSANTGCGRGNKKTCPAPTATLAAQPTTVVLGQSSTLSWSSQYATSLDLQPGIGTVAAQGSVTVSPQLTTSYTLTATGSGGTTKVTATINVTQSAPGATLTGTPSTIAVGNYSTLSWSSQYATSLDLQPGIGAVATQGSLSVSPLQSTTYTLTATGSGGTTKATSTINVTQPTPTATLSSTPSTITQGSSSTLDWSSQYATSLDLEPGIGTVAAQGSIAVSPQLTTTYTLTATGSGGTVTTSTKITVNPAGVQLYPGNDIQAAVNANPSGTTFILNPGTYRLQRLVPKDGDVFSGQTGAILNGAILVTSWQTSSNIWVAQVSGITQASSYRGVCLSTSPACMYPEDLFFDSQPQTRVASLASVIPGAWYFDYAAQKAYAGSNPTGHVTEISTSGAAFSGSASSVTLRNLIIEKYASIAGYGAIQATSTSGGASNGWIVDSNELRLNHGMGLRISNSMQVTRNKFHDNGQMGLGGTGSNVLIENNEIYKNNYAGYSWNWEAGGDKFTWSTNLTIRGNYSHDNNGPGLWTDINNDYVLYENNHTTRNVMAGIDHEISFHATIRNNLIENDGFSPLGTGSIWWGSGILIQNSSNVEVYGNTVTNCMDAIGGIQADRGNAPDGTPYRLMNLNVHDNIVTQQVNYAEGIVKATVFDNSVFTSWGNHFQNDTYYLTDLSHPYFLWLDQKWTLSQWNLYASEH
jgi:hypothetical protein